MRPVWLAVPALAVLGCDPAIEDIGKPCSKHSDCASGLECDVHDGQGTCQKPHDDTGDEEPLPSSGEDPDHDDDPDPDPDHDHGTTTGGPAESTSGSTSDTDDGTTGTGAATSTTTGEETGATGTTAGP